MNRINAAPVYGLHLEPEWALKRTLPAMKNGILCYGMAYVRAMWMELEDSSNGYRRIISIFTSYTGRTAAPRQRQQLCRGQILRKRGTVRTVAAKHNAKPAEAVMNWGSGQEGLCADGVRILQIAENNVNSAGWELSTVNCHATDEA